MRAYDMNPLLRSSVGFDRFVSLFDNLSRASESVNPGFPPYDIEKRADGSYRITMAVAGFDKDDLEITVNDDLLIVTGKAAAEPEGITYLHRGIARRAFERRFTLAEHVRVTGASQENGLLHIDLKRDVPEDKKPHQIAIETAQA